MEEITKNFFISAVNDFIARSNDLQELIMNGQEDKLPTAEETYEIASRLENDCELKETLDKCIEYHLLCVLNHRGVR